MVRYISEAWSPDILVGGNRSKHYLLVSYYGVCMDEISGRLKEGAMGVSGLGSHHPETTKRRGQHDSTNKLKNTKTIRKMI